MSWFKKRTKTEDKASDRNSLTGASATEHGPDGCHACIRSGRQTNRDAR